MYHYTFIYSHDENLSPQLLYCSRSSLASKEFNMLYAMLPFFPIRLTLKVRVFRKAVDVAHQDPKMNIVALENFAMLMIVNGLLSQVIYLFID